MTFLRLCFAAALFAWFSLAANLPHAFATVNTTSSTVTIAGNGSQTAFPFSFIGVQPGDIYVTYTDSFGNQTTLTQGNGPTQYQLTLNAPVPGAIWGLGGTVFYDPSSVPIAAGTTLTISRTLPLLQPYSLANQGNLSTLAKSSEQATDQVLMALQQVANSGSYDIAANSANSAPPAQLPPAAQAAGLGLCFDSTGLNVIACSGTPSGVISSAMAPVVSAVSLAAGRTAFGLGTLATYGLGAGLQSDGVGNARVNFTPTPDAVNMTVVASFHQTARLASGPFTYTFPLSSTFWNGFGFWVYPLPGTGAITLAPNSSDNFIGLASGASYTLYPSTSAYVTTNATGTWYAQIFGTSSLPNHVPGEMIKMRTQTCPPGTLPENGASLSTTAYPALFAAIGYSYGGSGSSFNVPNSGGQFDRNWISGQTVDSGRTFGATQLDAFQGHTFTPSPNPANVGTSYVGYASGGLNGPNGTNTLTIGPPTTLSGFGTPRTAVETRPTNITVHSCLVTGE